MFRVTIQLEHAALPQSNSFLPGFPIFSFNEDSSQHAYRLYAQCDSFNHTAFCMKKSSIFRGSDPFPHLYTSPTWLQKTTRLINHTSSLFLRGFKKNYSSSIYTLLCVGQLLKISKNTLKFVCCAVTKCEKVPGAACVRIDENSG